MQMILTCNKSSALVFGMGGQVSSQIFKHLIQYIFPIHLKQIIL